MSRTRLPNEVIDRLAAVSDSAWRKRLNSKARYLFEKDYTVQEVLSEIEREILRGPSAPRQKKEDDAVKAQSVISRDPGSVVLEHRSDSDEIDAAGSKADLAIPSAEERSVIGAFSSEVQSAGPIVEEKSVRKSIQKDTTSAITETSVGLSGATDKGSVRQNESSVCVVPAQLPAPCVSETQESVLTGTDDSIGRLIMFPGVRNRNIPTGQSQVISSSVLESAMDRGSREESLPAKVAEEHQAGGGSSPHGVTVSVKPRISQRWILENQAEAMSGSSTPAAKIERDSLDILKAACAAILKGTNLYSFARVLIYCAIIATSRQPVDDFFQTLNVFGAATLNSFFALAVTIVMDLIAMNLFGRAISAAFGRSGQLELTLAFGLPAAAIILANVLLTQRNIEAKANVQTNAKTEAKYDEDLAQVRAEQKAANAEYAAAAGVHFAKRWKGAPDPDACESGKVSCKGPFVTGNEKEQAAYEEKKTLKKIADKAVDDLEATKPRVTDSMSAAGVDQKLWVYLVLWAGILLSYVYEPRKKRVAMTVEVAG